MANKNLIAITPGKHRYANIVWQVSDVCNFRCSYCNEGNWGAKFHNRNLETYLSVLDKIITYFQSRNYRAFKFFFSGGEPSIWPPLIPICEFINSKIENPLLAINTNLSRPLSWWKENAHFFHDVVASFHIEHTNKDRYIENAEYLQYQVPYLALRMLMHDARFQEVQDFSAQLQSKLQNFTLEFAPLLKELSPQSEDHYYKEEWKRVFLTENNFISRFSAPFQLIREPNQAFSMEQYSDHSSQVLNSNRIVAENRNHFEGWKCWINDNIFIHPRGDISLASCGVSGIVGNINDGTIRFFDEPIICPKNRCNCGTDICIPKVRSDKINEVII